MDKMLTPNTRSLRSNTKRKALLFSEDESKGDEDENEIENYVDEIHKNPLKNPLIVDYVFKLLNLEDIKQCRLVCSQWKILAHSFIEKMSVIKVGHPSIGCESNSSPKAFKEFASDFGATFIKFKLEHFLYHQTAWPHKALVEFLNDQRRNMRELKINNIKTLPKYFNLTPHINSNLTHLNIDCGSGNDISISTDKITTTKYLSLQYIDIDVANDCKLTAKKLKLNHVSFLKNGHKMHNFKINEILDFKNLKDLNLEGNNIIINLAGKIKLDNLTLKYTRVEQFGVSEWEVGHQLKLIGIPLTNPLLIKFTQLIFGNATICLNALPDSIEKLTISKNERRDGGKTIIICPATRFTLPNLKYLQLLTDSIRSQPEEIEDNEDFEDDDDDGDDDGGDDDDEYDGDNPFLSLNAFDDYENLTTIKLVSKVQYGCLWGEPYQHLNTDWIPTSTKTLILSGKIRAVGNAFQLEKLVIEDNTDENIIRTLLKLKTENVVLNLSSIKWNKDLEKDLLDIIKKQFGSLALGPLEMKENAFYKTSFSQFVDKFGKYYRFQYDRGNCITESEFERLTGQQH